MINEGGDHDIKSKDYFKNNDKGKVDKGGSIDNHNLLDDEPQVIDNLSNQETRLWFDRGSARFIHLTRIETLLERVLNLELYVKELM